MDFDPINSLFGSPPRDGHVCRQNRTYNNSPRNNRSSTHNGETLLQNAKTQSTSVRVTRGINLNLLSRISKFEALDALSMPIKLPSLRPAHLQISRKFSSFQGIETSHRKRLSTIFSPSSEHRNEYIRIEDEETSEQDILASHKSSKWLSPKTAESRKMQTSEAPYSSVKIEMRGDVRETTDASENKGIGTVTSPYVQNEVPARKKSMGDMIKLYDGSSDKVVSKSSSRGKNKKPSPSRLPKQIVTPRKANKEIMASPGASTASSRCKPVVGQTVPTTPTKPFHSFASKQRQPLNVPNTPASTASKPSPSKSSISNISQGTVIRTRASSQNMKASTEKSPIRVTLKRGTAGSNRSHPQSSTTRQQAPVPSERGRTLVRPDCKDNPPTKLSEDKRKISGKIEDLYSGKSLERNNESHSVLGRSQDVPSTKSRTLRRADPTRQAAFEVEKGRTRSRVADIRMKFEGAVAPSLPMPLFSNISPFSTHRKAKSDVPAPLAPMPVFLPPSDSKRSANVSPKTVQDIPNVKPGNLTLSNHDPDALATLTATQKQTNKGSSTIKDRIKLFESIQQTKKPEGEKNKSRYARRIRTSMKSLFESQKSEEDGARELSNQDVRNIIDEFQDTEALLPKTGKRGTLIGRWTFPGFPATNTTDGTVSEKGGSPCEEGVTIMIVKEVECGLKQPKPVRITEMKSMMLLCRDRVGNIIEKEKSRVALSQRKL